jgi:hypothetical protein
VKFLSNGEPEQLEEIAARNNRLPGRASTFVVLRPQATETVSLAEMQRSGLAGLYELEPGDDEAALVAEHGRVKDRFVAKGLFRSSLPAEPYTPDGADKPVVVEKPNVPSD